MAFAQASTVPTGASAPVTLQQGCRCLAATWLLLHAFMVCLDTSRPCLSQGIFNLARALWHGFPAMLHGSSQMPPLGNIGVIVSGLFSFLVYTIGMQVWYNSSLSVLTYIKALVNLVGSQCPWLLLVAGSGLGNPRNQSRGLLFLYGVVSAINAALVSRLLSEAHG